MSPSSQGPIASIFKGKVDHGGGVCVSVCMLQEENGLNGVGQACILEVLNPATMLCILF